MQGGVVELARQAAAAARAERGVRGPARRGRFPYRGVMRQGDMYVAEVMDAAGLRPVCLGMYETPEEAAYAYDAAARIIHGNKAKPNFPAPPAPAPMALGGGGAPATHAAVLPRLVGHARMRAAPVGGGAHRQVFSYQQAPAPHFQAPQVPYHGGAVPVFSQFLYHPAAGPAFAAAGGSNGAGFYAAGPALAAAGGSNGAGFYGMAPMIGPEPEVPMPTYAASSALSSSDKKYKAVVDASAAAGPKLVIILEFDGELVEDNFNLFDGGASTSSAVPPLRFKDLMETEVVRRSADERAP